MSEEKYKGVFEAVLDVIGYTGEKDVETFDAEALTAHMNTRFLTRSRALEDPEIRKAVRGRIRGEVFSGLGRVTGAPKSSFDDLDTEDAIVKAWEGTQSELARLQDQQGKESDERIVSLTEEVGKWKQRAEEHDKARKTAADELEAFKQESGEKFRRQTMRQLRDKATEGIQWIDGINDVQRAGFRAIVQDRFKFGIEGDEDNPVLTIMDAEGNRIPHRTKSGEYANPADVLQALADEKGLVKKNEVRKPGQPSFARPSSNGDGDKPLRVARRSLADKLGKK